MKVQNLKLSIDKTLEFDYSNQNFIPEEYGCYLISNFNNEIMYIGKASSLKVRFTNHLETPEKNKLTKLGRAYWFSYKLCKDENEIARLERSWLNTYELEHGTLPIFNNLHA